MRSIDAVFVCVVGICASAAGCSGGNGDCLSGDEACLNGGPSGSSSGGGSCGNTGLGFFEKSVLPILVANCAQCHSAEFKSTGPDFLGASTAEFYAKLTSKARFVNNAPNNSALLHQGEHAGPAFTSNEAATVSQWLTIEADERFGACSGVQTSTCNAEELLTGFAACMTVEDWKASKMHEISMQNTDAGLCYGCHFTGQGGNFMTNPASDADILLGFDNMRVLSPLLRLVAWPETTANGECSELQPSYRWRDKGTEEGTHPKYVLDAAHEAALDQWFTLTYTKWKNGSCPTP